jgi:hypothetical protein
VALFGVTSFLLLTSTKCGGIIVYERRYDMEFGFSEYDVKLNLKEFLGVVILSVAIYGGWTLFSLLLKMI